MRILIWAGMFFVLTAAVLAVASAAMMGMPIASSVQFGMVALVVLLGGWGVVLLNAERRRADVKTPVVDGAE